MIGLLSYLAVGTRPDLSFSVNFLARYAKSPQDAHWNALQHLIRFLRRTKNTGIDIDPQAKTYKAPLEAYLYANWGGVARSLYGHATHLIGVPIAWVEDEQACVAASNCHTEFMAIGAVCRDSVWLHSLTTDVLPDTQYPLSLCDNSSSVHVSTEDASNKRTRHAEQEFYYINKQIFKNCATLKWIPENQQVANIFTKPLGPLKHKEARKMLV